MQLRSRRRRGRIVVAGLAVALAAAGCGSSAGGAPSTADATLVVYTGQAGDYQINFNPFSPTTIDGPGTIFEPLFFFNMARTGEPVPRLGTAYSWNDDGTVLTVTLRDNATWTDGTRFTAKDVVFTLDMVKKNSTINGTGYDGTAKAVDEHTVEIAFDEPAYSQGPQVLGRIWMVPEHVWSTIADPANDVIAEPMGTGPFMLEEFKGQAFTLKANPTYWDGEPAVKRVRYVALSGNQAGADALAAGTIDWQTGPVPDIKNVERNYPGYKAISVPLMQIALFTCSNADLGCTGHQTDPAVRKAIYYGMNRTQLNALAFEDTASPISPGFALVDRDAQYLSDGLADKVAPMEPDVAKATALLEGAGFAKGGDGVYAKNGKPLAFNVLVPAGWTDYITALDTMGQQLQAIGVKLTTQQVSWNEWSAARGTGKYEMLIDSLYQGPAADPYYMYSYFFSTATTAKVGETANPGYGRVSDPVIDGALAELEKLDLADVEGRRPHFAAIQERVADLMPYIPVLTGGTTSEYNAAKFTGWPTEDDLYAFPAVWQRPDHSQIFKSLRPAGSP
ncbi:ABC transporter substrate-binding protein [Actinokineospora fastidiosa]|uniref:Peptide ABC transporter substrate-binding protein n=1 Tax=Actinokineospora fastidiosa TaxID=1816 RepID=A0A918GPE1_9PSEU|nr:ABC transporter substrate-binding protein [Actinokineospora fastidiosa]GGS49406.1 peptide ABC transporter substrate-binding protein [Actinokineospora fastidiosa]